MFFYGVKELFKVNQIDIPDYQYYLGCNAKGMVRLTFPEKKFVFQSKSRLIRLFYFQKIVKFYQTRSFSK